MNASLRQLQAFVLVYRHRSITRAANELGITQSAASLMIRQLEEQFGVKLFDRTTRVVHPTVAATQAVATAERILGDSAQLARDMQSIAGAKTGRVTMMVSAGAASAVMPRILSMFRAENPQIDIAMQDVAADELVPRLQASEAEFAIGSVAGPIVGMTIAPLMKGRLCAIGPAGPALAKKRQLSWDELAAYSTIAMRRETPIRRFIDAALAAHGKALTPRYEVSLINTALAMTANGLGLSILPSYMLPRDQFAGLVARPLVRPTIWRDLSVVRREGRSLSPAAERFVALAKRTSIRRGLADMRDGRTAGDEAVAAVFDRSR